MTMKKTINITIDALGDPTIEGKGFVGRECDAAMKPIEDALQGSGEVSKQYDERWASDTTQEQHVRGW